MAEVDCHSGSEGAGEREEWTERGGPWGICQVRCVVVGFMRRGA